MKEGQRLLLELQEGARSQLESLKEGKPMPGMKRVKLNQRIDAGWCRAEKGDVVFLNSRQIAILQNAHGKDVLKVIGATRTADTKPEPDVDPTENRGIPGAPPAVDKRQKRRGTASK